MKYLLPYLHQLIASSFISILLLVAANGQCNNNASVSLPAQYANFTSASPVTLA